ncbi:MULTISPECIES: 23S rRNA pseudouridine(955/2504/2580) synthase RluC [unclassified Methylophaga]|jgi:23S rRNA pseudouridine955/2504/2580 synthase|uniref:23S rRNA pseudouridine(955/2504/2580) synthase RluC n=1 Tax=unclassified Methylophaga TaxID=2629249 RepID=UPI000C943BFB|nr:MULTISPECIES: 23S rRNA pseudouridine(955/2504/2580) synthase RluC [unclassified Methylophaga]MAK66537.1 23S rRNA pseudouridine(955/2504/2580) synthase RluC [Methylophaga sp.]MAY17230.1 23S rRNA pseudouridine(955/2504/2580) synthase RluC [Methylophaga sp.]MBN45976.1 23S rRNA pseudouridine(955/2504/2580) synthase RluC [Methylophaga sp.]HAO23793.1 23S rRNA pseudouridine(955/2504/2580) synthase RluC [Methylophaga sp.]HCD04544.1 23S rRNA pseudouridine(955/2504/2580) synthase RluC [Methylophaga s|tara:strand:+ start:152 stop:1111 length:960 start_codon:yes stop_codon:yes gene_type:complete
MANSPQASPAVQFIDIRADQAGQRIDNFLITLEKGVPKSRIYRALRKGEVRVNKGRIKQTYRLQAGDQVRIPPLRVSEKVIITELSESLTDALEQSILLEDDALLVINKPSGLAVHAGSQIQIGVIEAMRIIRPQNSFVELVHRLDRDTSGCLVIAKSREALLNLQEQMKTSETDKRYLTLTMGRWPAQENIVDLALQKNTLSSGERMVAPDINGKKSKTLFEVKQDFAGCQLVAAKLYTGRTHQIRVHSASQSHPVAGDEKYGNREFNKRLKQIGLKRMFLHAWQLSIKHPITHEPVTFHAELPDTLKAVLKQLEGRS